MVHLLPRIMSLLCILFCWLAGPVSGVNRTKTATDIELLFKDAKIIPDILDSASLTTQLSLEYNGVDLIPGVVLTPRETENQPLRLTWTTEPNKLYTLIMLDPDVISSSIPIFRSFLHWMVINVQGNDVNGGEVKSFHMGPGPPIGTGFHRYVFLVFEQLNGHLEITTDYNHLLNRPGFSMRNFITTHTLSANPIAGNYFLSQFTLGH